MQVPKTHNPQIQSSPEDGISIGIQGFRFETPTEVMAYFSMYGAHILEGTVIAGGGYNANEWCDGSMLQIFRTKIFPQIRYGNGVISSDSKRLQQLQSNFNEQYPLWSGSSGDEDIKQKLWSNFGYIGDLQGTLRLSVDFIIECNHRDYAFQQDYLLGLCKRGELGITLVGSRKSLYSTYKEAFQLDYPLQNLQPLIQEYQTDPKIISEIRNRKY